MSTEPVIKIEDLWASEGTVIVEGQDWNARLTREAESFMVSSGTAQIHIAQGQQPGDESIALFSSRAAEQEDDGSVTLSLGFRSDRRSADAKLNLRADGTLQIVPGPGTSELTFSGDIAYGVLPGLYLEDVIFDPAAYAPGAVVHVPSESLFWVLLGEREGILVLAWPNGEQTIRLVKGGGGFNRFEILMDEKPVYLKLLAAPGIWHREQLKLNYLEKDVQLGWQRPFDGQWKTQLLVNKVPTTWIFDRRSMRMWIPMLGFFRYPVWFEGPSTMLHMSKKIPPKGHCFIYPLDGHPKTPLKFLEHTPVAAMIKQKMQRIRVDKEHSDRATNVGYVHCWGTSIIQRTIYKNGLQSREKEFLAEHIDYCVDYVRRIQMQSLEYYAFIQSMRAQLDTWIKESPADSGALEFLEKMKAAVDRVEDMYHSRVERGGRKTPQEHMKYAADLGQTLKQLILDPGRESFPQAKFILDSFNALSAATDEDVPAGFGITIREMFQEAGSACTDRSEAVKYAEEIRRRIWQKTKARNYETTGL